MKINFKRLYLTGLFLIVLLPVASAPPLLFPPDWAKAILFRIVFSILIVCFISQILIEENFKDKIAQKVKAIPKFFLICYLGFALLLILSTIFSSAPHVSFWGTPARGDGSLNILFYSFLAIFSYLVLERKDWIKIWFVSAVGAMPVWLIAIAQQFNLLGKNILVASVKPPSTMGNPDALAVYLLLIFFISLGLLFSEKRLWSKIFYSVSCLGSLAVIIMGLSRAAYLGLAGGVFWFLFFYKNCDSKIRKTKIILGGFFAVGLIFIILLASGIHILPEKIARISAIDSFVSRISLKAAAQDVRTQAWKVGLAALEKKLLLGWGPENFSVGFDRYYNLYLPEAAAWWDRAHNFLLEIGVTMGIPALLFYMSFWLAIFLILQKAKKNSNDHFVIHAVQATILSLFLNKLFNFDNASTFLISYLIIGFSLTPAALDAKTDKKFTAQKITAGKKIIIAALALIAIIFIWQFNIHPLLVNAQINWSNYYMSYQAPPNCQKALPVLENKLGSHSIIDGYLGQEYINVVAECMAKPGLINKEQKLALIQKALKAGQESVKTDPTYTKSWIYLGILQNMLADITGDKTSIADADNYFRNAQSLSPNRYEIQAEWAKTYIVSQDYKTALSKIDKCIELNPDYGACYWFKGVLNIYLKNPTETEKYIGIAKNKKTEAGDCAPLSYFLNVYTKIAQKGATDIQYYKNLRDLYLLMVQCEPESSQYYASLAYVYKILGEYDFARKTAEMVLKLSPDSKQSVEEFIKTLPQ